LTGEAGIAQPGVGQAESHYTTLLLQVTRKFEFEADNFAVKLKHGEPLVNALRVLEKENKTDPVVDSLYSSYHYSHPPMQERIQAIQAAVQKTL
jgi:STE24 endopeptidase